MNRVIIYTDGACSPNPGIGGWAAILISPSHANYWKEISGGEAFTTNNRMELMAAVMALSALKHQCAVQLHTDSQYLRKAFSEGWLEQWLLNGWTSRDKKPVANQDLWKNLVELGRGHELEWHWVKGHGNDPLNDRCDELAVEARKHIAEKLKADRQNT